MSFEFLVLSGQWSEMYRSRNICNSRIEVADALRGVAVMGIILLHAIDHFDVFTAEPITYMASTRQDVWPVRPPLRLEFLHHERRPTAERTLLS